VAALLCHVQYSLLLVQPDFTAETPPHSFGPSFRDFQDEPIVRKYRGLQRRIFDLWQEFENRERNVRQLFTCHFTSQWANPVTRMASDGTKLIFFG